MLRDRVAGEGSPGRIALELIRQNRGADDALEGRGSHDRFAAGGHQNPDRVPLLGGEASQLKRLVGGDAATPSRIRAISPPRRLGLVLVLQLARRRLLQGDGEVVPAGDLDHRGVYSPYAPSESEW